MTPPNSGLLREVEAQEVEAQEVEAQEVEAQEAEVQEEALAARLALATQLMDLCSALETALHKPI
jgi:hypothetical protein